VCVFGGLNLKLLILLRIRLVAVLFFWPYQTYPLNGEPKLSRALNQMGGQKPGLSSWEAGKNPFRINRSRHK